MTLTLDFEISDNYGPAPLTVHVVDVTDYTGSGFLPTKWSWRILDFGCYITTYGYGGDKRLTIARPGQYGVIMIVSDGTNTYSLRRDDCIFVTNPNESQTDMIQIEFAHNSSPEAMRHNIRTEHDYNDADKNSLSVFLWGTEQSIDELGKNEILKIKTDRMITRNITPMTNDIYNLGTELLRYSVTTSSDIIMKKNTQSKILRTWSGR